MKTMNIFQCISVFSCEYKLWQACEPDVKNKHHPFLLSWCNTRNTTSSERLINCDWLLNMIDPSISRCLTSSATFHSIFSVQIFTYLPYSYFKNMLHYDQENVKFNYQNNVVYNKTEIIWTFYKIQIISLSANKILG